MDDRDVSRIYAQVGLHPENIQRFIACRIARNKQSKMLLSVDSTTIAWDCSDSEKARIGKGKKGQFENQIGLAVTFNTTTHQPILYRVLPGNINDCQTVLDLLTRFDEFKLNTPTCAAALDRGYFSDENLLLAHETKAKCIFTAKTSIGWIEETIARARAEFFDSKKGILSVESTLKTVLFKALPLNDDSKLTVSASRSSLTFSSLNEPPPTSANDSTMSSISSSPFGKVDPHERKPSGVNR